MRTPSSWCTSKTAGSDTLAHEPATVGESERSTEDASSSWATWQKIGRQALRLEPRAERKTLRDVARECEDLVVIETWQAHGRNITHAAEALGVSRKRVRSTVKAWLDAQRVEQQG